MKIRDTHSNCMMDNDFPALFNVHSDQSHPVSPNNHASNKPTSPDRRRYFIIVSIVALLLLIVMIASICLGRYPLSFSSVLSSLAYGARQTLWKLCTACGISYREPIAIASTEVSVVWLVRFPRVIAAVLVGGALSFSGATYQSLFRNPMVSPDILGASAGASVGACLMMLMEQSSVIVQIGAFAFGIIAVLFSYLLSQTVGKTGNSTLVLVLCGMTVGALFQAFVSIIKYLADPDSQLPEMTYWLMGSIAKVDIHDIYIFLPAVVLGTIPILILSWKLNIMSLGEDDAKAMGVNVPLIRIICIICSTLLTASVVSYAGTIGWVGLMIPHLCRLMIGSNNRYLLPLSFLGGSLFLLIIDDLCRTLFAYEIPLGVLTSILGTPFFIFILCRRKGAV